MRFKSKNSSSMQRIKNQSFTLFSLIFLSFIQNGYGQFILNGTALDLGSGTYRVASAVNYEAGAIWSNYKINLAESFSCSFGIQFTNDDSGADGIAFVLQPNDTNFVGLPGGALAYQPLTPSFAVEFDIFDNSSSWGDIADDHCSLLYNGQAGVPITPAISLGNIEDGIVHTVQIDWNVTSENFRVIFDSDTILCYNLNLINNIFCGTDSVYFGFTSATYDYLSDQDVYWGSMISPFNFSSENACTTLSDLCTVLNIPNLNFNAENLNDKIRISWVCNEPSIKSFIVEKLENGIFEEISPVIFNNNNSQDFEFDDLNISSGSHFYRLKCFTSETIFFNSNTIYIDLNISENVTISPNPAHEILFFNTVINELNLYDLNGKLLLTDYNINSLNISMIQSGLYYLTFKTNNSGYERKKLAVIK